ncbi:unnamed protein product [Phytomonas sp. EM1]|nr:unnamed protein product [Phytomonas sp. EM1]|eukprot:CCW62052.1 unnamed protein product [Phytomonas sp. isolate EM1]
MKTLTQDIKSSYGVYIPFFEGSLTEAREKAQSDTKYFVIYLHCPTHEDTKAFVKSILGKDEVIAHFVENSILYGSSVMEREGHNLSIELGIMTYPSVVVYFKGTVVMKLQGLYTKDKFLEEWRVCTSMWDCIVAEEISLRFERKERERIRQKDEEATSEMEKADIKRLERLAEEERMREEAARADEERVAREAAQRLEEATQAAQRQREEMENARLRQERRAQAMARLPTEPPENTDPSLIVFISLKTLSGKQKTRCFFRTDHVDCILDFATSLEENDGEKLKLVTGFPPSELQWVPAVTTIGEIPSLCPRAVVLLRRG